VLVSSKVSGRRERFKPSKYSQILWVISDISLQLEKHQVKVLIGASGSGKSTLLRCINLLEEIDDGQIILDGEDISEVGVIQIASALRLDLYFNPSTFFHI